MRAFVARPAADTELRHGYTLTQVSALSVFAVKRGLWHQAADFDERLEIAWHAIIDYLYATPDTPKSARSSASAGRPSATTSTAATASTA
jgi:hypothetical protein